MKRIVLTMAAVAIVTGGSLSSLNAETMNNDIATLKDAQWGPAPPMLPPGAQIAVISGDPTQPGAYVVRVKFPAHYEIPPHAHPTAENVVIASGYVTVGNGNKLVKGAPGNKTLGPGDYALMSGGMNHYVYTSKESTIILYGQGPVDFNYVNPADDPRNAKKQ